MCADVVQLGAGAVIAHVVRERAFVVSQLEEGVAKDARTVCSGVLVTQDWRLQPIQMIQKPFRRSDDALVQPLLHH